MINTTTSFHQLKNMWNLSQIPQILSGDFGWRVVLNIKHFQLLTYCTDDLLPQTDVCLKAKHCRSYGVAYITRYAYMGLLQSVQNCDVYSLRPCQSAKPPRYFSLHFFTLHFPLFVAEAIHKGKVCTSKQICRCERTWPLKGGRQ